jgi:hypothetical protein
VPVPTFCRHNRLLQHCPICAAEQQVDLTPAISPSAPRTELGRRTRGRATRTTGTGARERRGAAGDGRGGRKPAGAAAVQVRRLERGADDGYRCPLAPGLHSSVEAARLAEEVAFAAERLLVLAERPPGLYAEVAGRGGVEELAERPLGLHAQVADPDDVEERVWLAFLIAYLCPVDDEDPFAGVRRVRSRWGAPELPDLRAVETGPRSSHDAGRPLRSIQAYRMWARRAGSQAAAFTGDPTWTAERRFTRVFERMALPGLQRDARFDLLVTLGRLGIFDLRPGQLMLGGSDEVTVGAKRVFGIGDPLILEGRAAAFARASDLPLAALDLGIYNWQRGERAHLGLQPGAAPAEGALVTARAALEL